MNNNESIINLLKHQIIYKDTSKLITNQINTNRLTIKQEFLQDNYESIYLPDEVMILGKKKSVHRLYIKKVVKGDVVLFGGWICDNDIDSCMICNYMFNFIYRSKHHCRSCGNLVCINCSPNTAIIQGLEDYHHQRVCVQCYWGQDIVYPIESMISNYIISNQSTSDESDDDKSIQFDLLDIYLDNKSNKKKDRKIDTQIDSKVDSIVDSSKIDWKVSNYSVDSETDSEIESYLLSEITKEYQNQFITNQLKIDNSINDISTFNDDKSFDNKLDSKVDTKVDSKLNSKLVSQLDIKIDSKLNSPTDFELNDYSDSKLTISSTIINNQLKKNPLQSNKSSIISKRLSSRTFSFTTIDSANYSSSVSVESIDNVDSPIDNTLDSSIRVKLDDCIDIPIYKQLDDLLVDELVSKIDGKIDIVINIDCSLDSKLYDNLNNQLVNIILNQVDSYTDTNVIITADSTIDSQIDSNAGSNIEIEVDSQIDFNADRESKIERKLDSNIDSRIVLNADSCKESKLVSIIDSKVDSSLDSTIDSPLDSKIDIEVDSKIDSKTDNTTDANTSTCIYPLAGKVIKTKQINPLVENSKLFINLCYHSIYPLSDTIDSKTDSPIDDLTIYLGDIKIWNNLNFRTIDVLIRTTSYELYLIDKEIEIKLNHLILSSIESRYAISLDHNISYPKTNNNYKGDIDELIMYINSYTHLSSSIASDIIRYDSYEDSKYNDMELDSKVDSTKIDCQLDSKLDSQIDRQLDVQLNSTTDSINDSNATYRRESIIDSELCSEADRGTFSRPSAIPKYLPTISNSLFRLSNNISKIPNRVINFLETNEVIIYSSIVGKKSPIGLKLNQERELVLTNYPRLLYHDLRSNKPPRQVLFSQTNKPIVVKVSKYIFQVKVFDPIVRIFEFTDRVNGSQTWIDQINSVL